ncbi:Cytotoxic translational repressor of toxin-antitoxin stability system [Halanaeroarchaeum sp. HSR-CO]|nr:Cytotoxic translational repressor of toxin-antitoxin stability system [Halanaeroarchaeum sp. HSR-CO]
MDAESPRFAGRTRINRTEATGEKLDEARDWTSHRLEKLTGYPYYKLRAGDYRAIITWDRADDVHVVEAVGHRRNIYNRHLPP